jgi:hypothetical protein
MSLSLQMSSLLTSQQQELGTLLSQQLTLEWADTILIPIISGAHAVSIRIMDWYVTNYTLAHGTHYTWTNPKSKECRIFSVHLEYGTTLNSKGRLLFDPFRRGPRVLLSGSNGMVHESTLGQLFFWRWATRYGVLDELMRPGTLEKVQAHMADQQQKARERKRVTGKRKRSALSKKAVHRHALPNTSLVVHVIKKVNCRHRFDDSDLEDDDDDQRDDDEASDVAARASGAAGSAATSSSSSSSSHAPNPTSSQSSATTTSM